ncbi:MAG TPA: hypothetical protein VF604_19105 [Pyrinomonadaceae bacterium]|jgi:hypothetical protein
MLALALVAKNASRRPSEILNIDDELLALDFDMACSYRLQVFDNERRLDDFKALSMMLGGKPDGGGEDVPENFEGVRIFDAPEIPGGAQVV